MYPEYNDAVLIKGSASYACKFAGVKAKVINIEDIAEIALMRSKKDGFRLRLARAHGCIEPYKQRTIGLNFMLDEVNAAVVALLLKRRLERARHKRM